MFGWLMGLLLLLSLCEFYSYYLYEVFSNVFLHRALQYIIALPIRNQTFMLKVHYHSESRENEEGLLQHSGDVHQVAPRDESYRQTPEDLV